MFKRIKRLLEVSKTSESEEIDFTLPIGDGKAEFLGEGTHEEYEESERERKGFKGIFGL